MRWKIVIANAAIVLIVGLLSYVLLLTALKDVLSNQSERKAEVERAIRSANAQLELDALRVERWLAKHAATEDVRGVFSGGTAEARSDSATAQANKLRDAAIREEAFARMAPALVLFVDESGVSLGRNGSNLMRGDKVVSAYPALAHTLKTGHTGSDVWLNRERQEQMLASYAAVHGEDDQVVGAIVMGTPLNDERLTRTSDLTSGRSILVGVRSGADKPIEVIAHGGSAGGDLLRVAGTPGLRQAAADALSTGKFSPMEPSEGDTLVLGTAPLAGYGEQPSAVLIAAVPASLVQSVSGVLWPVIAVTVLGLLLVLGAGFFLGNYISRPISQLEEGLLTIINGKTDLRFDIEHPDLGGLVFRINSLLNALMGVPETDDEGRTSQAPAQPYEANAP